MFRNILVSIDGSRHAQRALQEAIDMARLERSRLTLLTAVRQCPAWAYSPASAAAAQQLSADLEREAEEVMRTAVALVPDEVPVTTIVSHKPIRRALIEQVRSGGYDLLVMGSRGRAGLAASLLGSVSHYALNHSPIPVLIVHDDKRREPAAVAPQGRTRTLARPDGGAQAGAPT